ncbi:uncharacterized protein TNCV_1569401 [Trichonephila clavipes]|uniref:Uncharacterized protein n=1 Tax=Trichonephila clavipes TaxID=2585209 RepID=A0A8X6VPW1_TRICX|nr:uncharacterized protein TNCV_1569401 [Trichonephila clavipes]
MAPGSRCMSGNTCGYRMSRTYRWVVMVPQVNTRVQFPHAWHHPKRRRRWVGVKSSTRNGRRHPECPSARRFRMVQEDTRPLMKVLPVPRRRPMKLVVRMHFLRWGGLLDDWSGEGILSLVFV